MQNLMIGSSGSGKGYEICVYQIMPALQAGRKVITNMPLDLERWYAIDNAFRGLIELRKFAQPIRGTWEPTREQGAFNLWEDGRVVIPEPSTRPFSGVWDYYTDWKHPATGQGALFIVDEAQYVIPRAKSDVAVEEWSALHRHFNVDIIWATQSYGKLSSDIRDNIQMVYRLRKKTAWGQPDQYIRKVQDGIRGEVMNVTQRKYERQFFGLWKSHTQGVAAEEFSGSDVKPFYHHWTFKGTALCFIAALVLVAVGFTNEKEPVVKAVAVVDPSPKPVPTLSSAAPVAADVSEIVSEPVEFPHPYAAHTIHLRALVRSDSKLIGYFGIAQNGQLITTVSFDDMRDAGYVIGYKSDSVVTLAFNGHELGYVIADSPTVTVQPATASL